MLTYLAMRFIVLLVHLLPRRWGVASAKWAGRMVYRVSPMAEAGRDNFWHVLGPDADPRRVSQLAQHAFENRLVNYYDLLWLSGRPSDQAHWPHIDGIEDLERVILEGRGVVVVAPHFGPVEYMIQGVTSLGYDLIGIQEHMKNERLHQYVLSMRSTRGLEFISPDEPLIQVYRRLKRGGVLLTAVDRDSTETGTLVDFFGAPAWMPDGYARLAVRAGVPVVFGYPWRTDGTAGGKVFPPIYPDRSKSKDDAVKDIVKQTVRLLEEAVRSRPDQWHLSTPIWQLARERGAKSEP